MNAAGEQIEARERSAPVPLLRDRNKTTEFCFSKDFFQAAAEFCVSSLDDNTCHLLSTIVICSLVVIQLAVMGDTIDKPLGQHKAYKIPKQLSSLLAGSQDPSAVIC